MEEQEQPQTREEEPQVSDRTLRAERRDRTRNEQNTEQKLATINNQMQMLLQRIQKQEEVIARQRIQMTNQENALLQHGQKLEEQAQGLAAQSTDLTVHKTIIDTIKGSKLTHLNITEEALVIERAKNAKIYDIPISSELPIIADIVANDPFLYQKVRKFKTLLTEFQPKLSRKVHVAEWYKNFEYMVKTHNIPTSIVRRNMVTATFTNDLKAEYLLVREVKNLEEDGGVNYDEVKKWVYQPEVGKYTVIEQLQKIFRWKQGKETLLEAYDGYNLVVRAFVRELKFAEGNGVSTLELDHPDETTLAKQFINNIRKEYKAEMTRTCKLIGQPLNMALLKVICERVNTAKGGTLGIREEDKPIVKEETMVTARLEKKVDRVLEICALQEKIYNNWQGRQPRRPRRNKWYNSNANNTGNNRTSRRTRNNRNARMNKVQRAMRKCYHCKRSGHIKRQCWELYPHLKKSFFERVRNNRKGAKQIFMLDQIQEVYAQEEAEDPVDLIAEEWDQEEVFMFTNEDFTFEENKDEQEEDQTNETSANNESAKVDVEEEREERDEETANSLAEFYGAILNQSLPRQ